MTDNKFYSLDWDGRAVQALPENDRTFLARIFSGNTERYSTRLKNIGFQKLGHVLDAGAGFGQWALALQELGNTVSALDIDMRRNRVLKEVAHLNGLENIFGLQASLERLPYRSQNFDGVFSFSSIYFLHYQLALDEFARVLKPGGLLYVNTNDIGWFFYLMLTGHNASDGYNPRGYALRSIMNTMLGVGPPYSEQKGSQFMSKQALIRSLETRGFRILAHDGDGLIDIHQNRSVRPLLPARFLGVNAVYEVLAKKS